jgi:hypothetical protein
MKNEKIRQFTEITPLEALKLLVKNGGHPVANCAFSDDGAKWNLEVICGVDISEDSPFAATFSRWSHCATVTEIDPCVAPEGCPELEPWMAYVGDVDLGYIQGYDDQVYRCCVGATHPAWHMAHMMGAKVYKAIDVRTAWAQEHFPEHCRIRNYQEYDPRMDLILPSIHTSGMPFFRARDLSKAYELGQQNPTK